MEIEFDIKKRYFIIISVALVLVLTGSFLVFAYNTGSAEYAGHTSEEILIDWNQVTNRPLVGGDCEYTVGKGDVVKVSGECIPFPVCDPGERLEFDGDPYAATAKDAEFKCSSSTKPAPGELVWRKKCAYNPDGQCSSFLVGQTYINLMVCPEPQIHDYSGFGTFKELCSPRTNSCLFVIGANVREGDPCQKAGQWCIEGRDSGTYMNRGNKFKCCGANENPLTC